MPVGTQATVKAQLPETLEAAGSQMLLANTYHLLLRPGTEVFRRLGGIHGLTSWNRGVLTDSGGFQIFSLPHSRSMTEEGAVFQSYLDGRSILLSPELSIETQRAIGSDIMMVLDQCIDSTSDRPTTQAAMEITHRWAGIFGLTQDLLPLVGPVPGHEGVWVAAGYSGHGNVFGLLCGELVASAIEGKADSLLDLFAPARLVQHV
jgi:tRNA-guanine family transglycosylase